MSERDIITNRGFRYVEPVKATPGYDGLVRVYESSAASRPCVWISADPSDMVVGTTVHLTVEDALMFAEDIIRVCRNHYQWAGPEVD